VRVFAVLMLTQVVLFAEAGAVPALLVQLASAFKLTFPEQGYLGGIVYFGIAVGAPITSEFFKCANPKHVLSWTLLINMGSLLVFASVPAGWTQTLIGTRFLIGFTQATFSVYVPVWVDRFAPKDKATRWFSWLQITVPVGIMVGYLLGWIAIGLQTAPNNGGQCLGGTVGCWRLPFFFQVLLTVPVCCAVVSLPSAQLDVEAANRRRDAAAIADATPFFQSVRNYCADVATILRSFYFTMCVVVLTCMYFVLMSIQYWGTDFMIQGRSYSEHTTMLLFVMVSATAPIIGAILGGILVDKLGGFEGSVVQRSKCTGAIFVFNFVGTVFAVLTTYFPDLGIWFVVMCLWFVLFFGGMAVPALTGMYTAAIPEARLKILGSSIMLVVTSIGSYCLSPILAGYLMSRLSKEIPECKSFDPGTCPQALEQGFRWSLFMGIVAVFLMAVLWVGGCFVEGTLAGDGGGGGGKVGTVEEKKFLLDREDGGGGGGGVGRGGRGGYGGTSAGAAASVGVGADKSV
jgi:MFS family permease